jgi:UDP-3-O-[3-hydroxymyristoyl] glucosamine N-acyltransferase
MNLTTAEIAKQLGGEVLGDATANLTGFATASHAKPGDLTFAENAEYFAAAETCAATAIIAGKDFSSTKKTVIRVANPRVAYAKAVAIFFPEPKFTAGIHPSAVVAKSAQVDATAHIGPHCVIGERAQIGANCVLISGVAVGDDSVIGADTKIFANVSIYDRIQIGQRVRIHSGTVIGADGFSYVYDSGIQRKVPQIGTVIIGDDVELGANTCVDRGALSPTIVGKGTKIDNLVQVAHNLQVGEHCVIMGQVGMAGSTKIGNYVVIASQSGLSGHLNIGDRAVIGAKSGVMKDIAPGETVLGIPAQPDKQAKRIMIAMQRLPDLLKKVAVWEKKLSGE